MTEFLYLLFAFLPLTVCLVWLAVYVAEFRSSNRPKRFLTLFALFCALLYFCHAWFFVGENSGFGVLDAVYIFCNLSVYPLYYGYIMILTKDRPARGMTVLLLLPALVLSVAVFLTGGSHATILLAKAGFAIEVVLVALFGFKALGRFNKDVRNYYSDTEGKTLNGISTLLLCFILIALLSTLANIVGREAFQHSLLLGVPSLTFSALLFGIFYMGSRISFWVRDFRAEVQEDDEASSFHGVDQEEALLETRIAAAMDERRMFLIPGLKISDVAAAIGSNRTYVSNAINNAGGMSFSDYVNSRRIEFAKKLLSAGAEKGDQILKNTAAESGFASFPSFYRAFVKHTGMSPSEWLKRQSRTI